MEEEYEVRTLDELYGHIKALRNESDARWLDIGKRMNVSVSYVTSMIKEVRNSHFCTVCRLFEAMGFYLEFRIDDFVFKIASCVDFAEMLKRTFHLHPASFFFEDKKVLNYVYGFLQKKEVKTKVGTVLYISKKLGYSIKIKKDEQK